MFVSWVVFPTVTVLVCLGLGLLVDWAADRSMRPALWLPIGMSALICLTQLTTARTDTASLSLPVVIAAAIVGVVLGRGRIKELRDLRWVGLAALAVFVISGLPVIATGTPTFTGYTLLGDPAAHLSGAAELPSHGRDASHLAPSNYAANFLSYYTFNAYPSGGAVALGTLAKMVGQDPAWVFQPYLCSLVALLALGLAGLVSPFVASVRVAALLGFIGAQPAILVGFLMQGGLKEVGVSVALAALAAAIPAAAASESSWRAAIPLPVAAGAAVAVIGPSAVLWVGPLLLVALVLAIASGRSAGSIAAAATCVVVVGLVSVVQTLSLLDTATSVATSVASAGEAGNLLRPLSLLQALGVWLTGDFRIPPAGAAMVLTRALEAIVVLGVAIGVAAAISRRAWTVLAYSTILLFGTVIVVVRGSIWADAKALAIVSPGLLLMSAFGLVSQFSRHRLLAGTALAALTAGVVASNALIYRSASVAPHDRLSELAEINERFGGNGPILLAEFDEFGPYFLRDGRPDPAPLLIVSPGDTSPQRGAATDVDGVTTVNMEGYPLIVTRRGPIGSRPSSIYSAVLQTPHYTVWERTGTPSSIKLRAPIGPTSRQPLAVPECVTVRDFAREARRIDGKLVFATRPEAIVVNPALDDQPDRWRINPEDRSTTLPAGGGAAVTTVQIPADGTYEIWLEASVGRTTRVLVDGREVGRERNRLAGRRVAELVGEERLTAGEHSVTVERTWGGLAPGGGGLFRPLGPVYFVPAGDQVVGDVDPRNWRQLCGRTLDWLEVVA